MSFRSFAGFAAICSFWSVATAQPAPVVALDAVDNTLAVSATPAMWRVSDADSEVYLLGTFHILPPSVSWRTPALNEAFAAADRVYFEVDATAADAQSKTLGVMMSEGFLPAGETLSQMLEPADAERLKSIAEGMGMPLAAIDVMRPWQAFLSLSVQFIINKGFDPSAGVDSVLLSEARGTGKELKFFETINEQLGFFTGLSTEVEEELLTLTLRDWDAQVDGFNELFNAWATGNDTFIDESMNAQMREQTPEVFATLISQRNIAWAETLAADINANAGTTFVAVGAAHLVGEQSVQALLGEKGFSVARYGAETQADAVDIEAPINDNTPIHEGDDGNNSDASEAGDIVANDNGANSNDENENVEAEDLIADILLQSDEL